MSTLLCKRFEEQLGEARQDSAAGERACDEGATLVAMRSAEAGPDSVEARTQLRDGLEIAVAEEAP